MDDPQLRQELASALRTCGHFLYYQTGGRAGQRRILLTLLEHGGMTQRALQGLLDVRSGSLSEILVKMEETGDVERSRGDGDRRRMRLLLTPAGRAAALRMKAEYAEMLRQMFSCLSGEEQHALRGTLQTLTAHWDGLGATRPFEAAARENHCEEALCVRTGAQSGRAGARKARTRRPKGEEVIHDP